MRETYALTVSQLCLPLPAAFISTMLTCAAVLQDRTKLGRDAMIFATLSRPGAMGITWEERGEYTIITRIEAGSQASEHPELRIGLRLMHLDGSEIMGLDFSEALDLLRGAGRPVTLGLWDGQGPNPLSMEQWYATRDPPRGLSTSTAAAEPTAGISVEQLSVEQISAAAAAPALAATNAIATPAPAPAAAAAPPAADPAGWEVHWDESQKPPGARFLPFVLLSCESATTECAPCPWRANILLKLRGSVRSQVLVE